jgi:ABC-type Na+ transport system ATPase subunit NatA
MKAQTLAAKAKIGLVPQDLALYPTLSARQNLNFFGRIYGLKGKQLHQRVKEVLEMIGLTDKADKAGHRRGAGRGDGRAGGPAWSPSTRVWRWRCCQLARSRLGR